MPATSVLDNRSCKYPFPYFYSLEAACSVQVVVEASAVQRWQPSTKLGKPHSKSLRQVFCGDLERFEALYDKLPYRRPHRQYNPALYVSLGAIDGVCRC